MSEIGFGGVTSFGTKGPNGGTAGNNGQAASNSGKYDAYEKFK